VTGAKGKNEIQVQVTGNQKKPGFIVSQRVLA